MAKKKEPKCLARDNGEKCNLMGREIHLGSWSCAMCEHYDYRSMSFVWCNHPSYRDQ